LCFHYGHLLVNNAGILISGPFTDNPLARHQVDGMDAASVRRLGVRLTAEDVARVVVKAAHYQGSYGKVHWPVGWMARLMHAMGGMGPDRVSRFVARRIAA
jgi:hypothetical protein